MEPAQVDVELSFFPLMWILYFVSPRLSINGQVQKRSWGTHRLTLPPGRTEIAAWYPYIFRSETSKGSITVDLAPGAHYKFRYRPAWLVFLDGSMKQVDMPQLPTAQARQLPPS